MKDKTEAKKEEPTRQNPLVLLAEVLIEIDRRENIVDKEKIKNAANSERG